MLLATDVITEGSTRGSEKKRVNALFGKTGKDGAIVRLKTLNMLHIAARIVEWRGITAYVGTQNKGDL